MTEQPISSLEQARALVAELRQRKEPLPAEELNAKLQSLDLLLAQSSDGHAKLTDLEQKLLHLTEDAAHFNSVMVHEIRKPMTSIRGYSDMLHKPGLIGPLNEMQQQFVTVIRNNIINMEGLVSDISDINKLTYGKIRLDPKMTTFGQIMMEVQKQAEAQNADFGHTLNFEVPQGLPILTVDTKQLVKIIGHLMRNAIQYTPKTGTISLKAERLDGGKLQITIKDTGIGMSDAEIAKLGEPFFRSDNELVTTTKGYGLGIPVSKGFLKLMDSELKVSSTPNEGTTVSFVLQGM